MSSKKPLLYAHESKFDDAQKMRAALLKARIDTSLRNAARFKAPGDVEGDAPEVIVMGDFPEIAKSYALLHRDVHTLPDEFSVKSARTLAEALVKRLGDHEIPDVVTGDSKPADETPRLT